jgi:hypothetical protein
MAINLSIANDFSKTPGPRSRDEGDFSGEQFLEELLEPRFLTARETHQSLVVDLDGTIGYATSFLEAAFGGLARKYEPFDVLDGLALSCKDEPSLVEEVREYIKNARSNQIDKRDR